MRCCFFVLILTLCSFFRGFAQESMMKDIDTALLEKLVLYAKENYPRIQANLHRIKMSQSNIAKGELSYFDVFTFSYLHSANNTTTLVNPSLLNGSQYGIFFNFGTWAQKPAVIRAAKEETKALKLEKLAYDQNIEMEVRKRYLLYAQHKSMLRSKTTALVDAESALQEVRHRFEKGEVIFDDYNKALVVIEDHHQKIIESEASMLIAKVELEEYLGKKLEEFK